MPKVVVCVSFLTAFSPYDSSAFILHFILLKQCDEEVARGWRKLFNEQLNIPTLHRIFRVMKSRRMRWVERVAEIGGMEKAYMLAGKVEGKRQLRKSRRK
jgi:hypothetical protein